MENASYIEKNIEVESKQDNHIIEDEHTPKLFSDNNTIEDDVSQSDKLFDQRSIEDEEEFEIPAFLRKQKF